jgi:hypothetical protein
LIGVEVRDSCGISGTGETHRRLRRGGSPPAPRKACIYEGKSTTPHYLLNSTKYAKTAFIFHSAKRVLGNLMAVGKLDLSR